LKSEWRTLRCGPPGRRFQEHYDASHGTANRRTIVGRVVRMFIAIASIAIGVVLMFIPGPAILFFLIAGGLLAAESRYVARGLDCSEVQLRRFAHWLIVRWRRMPLSGKVFAGIAFVAVGASGLLVGYGISFG
jgi:hypothetical protein